MKADKLKTISEFSGDSLQIAKESSLSHIKEQSSLIIQIDKEDLQSKISKSKSKDKEDQIKHLKQQNKKCMSLVEAYQKLLIFLMHNDKSGANPQDDKQLIIRQDLTNVLLEKHVGYCIESKIKLQLITETINQQTKVREKFERSIIDLRGILDCYEKSIIKDLDALRSNHQECSDKFDVVVDQLNRISHLNNDI